LIQKSSVLSSAPHDVGVSCSPSRTKPPLGRPATSWTVAPAGKVNPRTAPVAASTHQPAEPCSALAYFLVTSQVLPPAQATSGQEQPSLPRRPSFVSRGVSSRPPNTNARSHCPSSRAKPNRP